MFAAMVLLMCAAGGEQAPAVREVIAEIRVHGNATIPDDSVVRLAGITVGAALEPDALGAIERRLRDSGRFDDVQVRKRYRTLAMDEVALVLIVHERGGVTAAGRPPSPIQRLRNRLMFLPLLAYDDGYGFTYGGRTSTVGLLGAGERLSVPLTWGATRRAALEAERTFEHGPISRLQGSVGLSQRHNPHFEVIDRRTELTARAERRLFGDLVLGAEVGHTAITFGGSDARFWTSGASATFDTRADPAFPSNAVLLGAGWNRLHQTAGPGVDRYRLDGRGYKRLFGQAVVAFRAQYDTATAPLPPYEQPLLGGAGTLRGTRTGTFAGDRRLVASAELRVPFSSPLSMGRTGFTVFLDAGLDAPFGQSLRDAPVHRGAGAGVFLIVPLVTLNFEVGRSLDGYGTRAHFSTGFSF